MIELATPAPPPAAPLASGGIARLAAWRGHGIGARLLLALIAFSSVVTTLITAVELYADYRNDLHGIDERVDAIRRSILPGLTESVWVSDGATIQAQLGGLVSLQDIVFAEVHATDDTRWSAGRDLARHRREIVLPITHPHRDHVEQIGDLRVVVSIDSVISRLSDRLLRTLVANAVKALLVTAFMLAAFQWLVGRHLDRVSAHLRSITPPVEDDAGLLRLDRPDRATRQPDELDHVVDAINRLHLAVRASHREVRDLNRGLEARVEQRTRELREARDTALAADRTKSAFLSDMSHEIRSPLNGMLGAINLMRQARGAPPSAADGPDYLAIAANSGETVLALINDVLDYSKIRAGKVVARDEPVAVNAVAAAVLDEHRPFADAKGLALRLEADPALAAPRLGDGLRLRQVLTNLVTNAVKFTAVGGVTLATRALPGPDGAPRLRIEVRDTGMGIAPADRERLFEPFVQLEGRAAEGQAPQPGTGLGLAIARGLVEALGGRLALDSTPGSTCFHFDLPWPPAPVAPAAPPAVAPAAAPSLSGRVLLVEDNAVNRLIAARMLRVLGLEVIEAHDGLEALDALSGPDGHAIRAVLMDCQMPGVDGFEATRRWRAHEATRGLARLPIVALTANVLREDVEACRAAGMDGHLGKPFTIEDLRGALGPVLAEG